MPKMPQECTSIDDVRAEIDRIDRDVIALIGERAKYVRVAAKFKSSEADVRASERFQAMLQQRRLWAVKDDLDPDIIEKLYRDLVQHFIQQEMDHWQASEQGKDE